MKKISLFSLALWLVFQGTACDKELFNLEKGTKEPTASEILSDITNFELNAGDTASFWVNASDPDGKTLTYSWSKQAGTFLTTSDQDQVVWHAPYNGGTYLISVSISNPDKSISRSRQVKVNSFIKPVVRILQPLDNAFLVQYQTQTVQVESFHDNGIASVALYIGGEFAGMMSPQANNRFSLNWYVDNPAGEMRLRAVALANTQVSNEDSILVKVEGVVPGKR